MNRLKPAVLYQGKDAWQWAQQYSHSPGPNERIEAATALREMGSQAVPLLLSKLRTKESLPRKVRLWLGSKLPTRMGRGLTRGLEPISFVSIQSAAARGLSAVGTNAGAAVPALIQEMRGPDLQLTWDAAVALGEIGGAAVLELIPLLEDSRVPVRHAAAYALGRIGEPALVAAPALIRHLTDPDPTIQTSVRVALESIGPAAGALVLRVVQENRGETRRAAARALVVIRPRAALTLPVLTELARDSEAEARVIALETLAGLRVNHTNALALYRNGLTDSNALVRAAGARALGEMFWKTRADVPLLAGVQTNDTDEGVRVAAQKAIEKILAYATNNPTLR